MRWFGQLIYLFNSLCLYGYFYISKLNTFFLMKYILFVFDGDFFNRCPMEYAPQPSWLIAFIDKTVMQRMYNDSWLKNPNIFYGVLSGCQLGGQGHLWLSRSSCYVTFNLFAKVITAITYTYLLVTWKTLVVIGPMVKFTTSKDV